MPRQKKLPGRDKLLNGRAFDAAHGLFQRCFFPVTALCAWRRVFAGGFDFRVYDVCLDSVCTRRVFTCLAMGLGISVDGSR